MLSVVVRGGAINTGTAPSGRVAPKPQKPDWSSYLQQSSVTTSPTSTPVVSEEDLKDEAKEQMESFLTLDSRNSFIGTCGMNCHAKALFRCSSNTRDCVSDSRVTSHLARVYAILAGQLFVTALSVVAFGLNPGLTSWMQQSSLGVMVMSLVLSLAAVLVICCSTAARHKSPVKWQLLALFTLGEAVCVGFISSFYHFRSVVSAMLATALATMGVSIYTVFCIDDKYDLSQWGASLASSGLIFVAYGFIHLLQVTGVLPPDFLPYNEKVHGLVGATLFSFYLAYDTKTIVGGKHTKYQLNEKDYIFGASTFRALPLNVQYAL
jgi:FtsH-binding integral membrane protein